MKKTLLTIFLAISAMGSAQITTSSSYTPAQLVNDVLINNPLLPVTNIVSSSGINFSSTQSLGYFNSNNSNFPFTEGIILTTGDITNAPGPNVTSQSVGGWGGDADLENFIEFDAGASSQNATSLQFDFIAAGNTLQLNFLFASEEYGFYQCSFGDAFAIILTDLGTGLSQNIGLIPGTTMPISVATVRHEQYNSNCGSVNPEYFDDYYSSSDTDAPINFNGVTVPMSAVASLAPGTSYRLKIVIADRADGSYDSALFIEGGSFTYLLENDLIVTSSNGYILCEEESTLLSVTDNPAYTYTWSTGTVGNSYMANAPGTYTVTVAEQGNTIETFTITILDNDATLITDGTICVDYETGEVLEPYLLDTGLEGNYIFTWSYNGVLVPGATTSSYLATMEGSYQVIVTDVASGCEIVNNVIVTLSSPPAFSTTNFNVNNQTATINVAGYGEYAYQLNGDPAQESNVFTNLDYGTHIITVFDVNGCGSMSLMIQITMPDAPDGMGEQTFTPGQTLADIEVEGENIQWYSTPGSATGRNANDNDDVPLPLTTPLVNNTTYYASQTINGIESVERLPVTVHAALATTEFAFAGLQYYPNPVKDVLSLDNAEQVDNILVYNLIGQIVVNKEINNTSSQIDLSALNEGIYLVRITAKGQEKTFRIIKE